MTTWASTLRRGSPADSDGYRGQSSMLLGFSAPGASVAATWDRFIDGTLIEIGRKRGRGCVDEDLIPPTPDALRAAVGFAQDMRDEARPAPTAVYPDGDGGIIFEIRNGRRSIQMTCLFDGSYEFASYDADGLVDHEVFARFGNA